ncbi:hypothetical protein [Streptacidiphilus anmyonensis]|uniref:hypothetical protein n=1 Tax=Streptacidiphilus anmyonensis TaxID=405782 RepID=UPI0005A8B158|nr:hypothetical protein [Streptacidiphilus anmyonensis]
MSGLVALFGLVAVRAVRSGIPSNVRLRRIDRSERVDRLRERTRAEAEAAIRTFAQRHRLRVVFVSYADEAARPSRLTLFTGTGTALRCRWQITAFLAATQPDPLEELIPRILGCYAGQRSYLEPFISDPRSPRHALIVLDTEDGPVFIDWDVPGSRELTDEFQDDRLSIRPGRLSRDPAVMNVERAREENWQLLSITLSRPYYTLFSKRAERAKSH